MNSDTRQAEYTEIQTSCGHRVFVRLDRDPITAAQMVAYFHQTDCGRSSCPATQARLAARLQTRGICWSDVSR